VQDELRARLADYLSQHRAGVLSTAGSVGAWATLVRYHSHDLEIDCLVPSWADAAYYLEQDPRVLLVITSPPQARGSEGGLRWLEVRGTARPVADPDWAALLLDERPDARPADRYRVVRVTPQRLDLFDESRGWGVRETLEL